MDDHFSIFEAALLSGDAGVVPLDEQLFLLLKGIILSLKQDASPQSIDLLAHAALACPLPEIAGLCITVLADMAKHQSQAALDKLYFLAVENNLDPAINEIRQMNPVLVPSISWLQPVFSLLYAPNGLDITPEILLNLTMGYQACTAPTRALITRRAAGIHLLSHWMLILQLVFESDSPQAAEFLRLYPEFSREEKTLSRQLLQEAAGQGVSLAIETLCDLFILHEDASALKIMGENNYFPGDSVRRAAFLFLSENWDQYQKFDYNHTLITLAYENAGEPVRKRLLNLSRQSGINDWLSGLSRSSSTLWLADMTDSDWIETITTSQQHHLWSELWKLAQLAPPVWAHRILTVLDTVDWAPETDVDFFAAIKALSTECTARPFEIRKERVLSLPGKNITCLSIDPQNRYLAAGTRENDIFLWNCTSNFETLPPLQGPTAMTRALAISPDGEYLVSANIDNALRIYKIPEGKLVKTLTGHENLVRTLAFHPDGRFLFSADFDGKMIAWRFPYGTPLSEHRSCKSEIYRLGVSPNGNLLFSAGACGHIHLWDWSNWREIKSFPAQDEIVTQLEIHPAMPQFIAATSSGKLTLRNYETEKILAENQQPPQNSIITALGLLSQFNLLAVGLNSAEIQLRFINSGQLISQQNVAGTKTGITGLALHDQAKMLLAATTDGKLYLSSLFPLHMALKPVQSVSSGELEKLQQLYKTAPSALEKKWLEFIIALVLRHKQYDILIEDHHHISIGEFDILL